MRISALLALFFTVAPAVALPGEIEAVRTYLPSETRLLLHVRFDTAVRDALIGLFPINPQLYRELVLAETAKLKEKFGFDPGEDLAGVVLVLGAEGQSLAGSMFAVGKKPMAWIFDAFATSQASPAVKLTVAGSPAVQSDDLVIALPEPNVVVVGSLEKVGLAIEKKGVKADVAGRLTALESSKSTAPLRLVGFPTPEQLQELSRQDWMQNISPVLVTKLTWIAFEMDLERMSLVLGFPEEGAATAAATQLGGVVEALKGVASSTEAGLNGRSENPVDRLDPELLVGRVLARTAQDVLAAATGEARGFEAVLSVPLEKLKLLQGPLSVPLLASMALRAYQQKAGAAVPADPGPDEPGHLKINPPVGTAVKLTPAELFGGPAPDATSVTPSPATTSP